MSKRTVTEAERQHGRYNLLTTGDVAERLSDEHITADTVRSWIESENGLEAVDLRRKGATRPAWYVRWESVEEFLRRRTRNAA